MRSSVSVRLAALLALLLLTQSVLSGPKEDMEERSRETEALIRPVSATYFGGTGIEQVAGAGFGRDGTVILFLNTWGPDVPAVPASAHSVLLGKRFDHLDPEEETYLDPEPGAHGAKLNHENINIAGVVVRLNAEMTAINSMTRFGFGVARFGPPGSCKVGPDGGLYVSGRGQAPFVTLAPQARARSLRQERTERVAHYDRLRAERIAERKRGRRLPELASGTERVAREVEEAEGRVVYLAKLSRNADRIEWALIADDVSRSPNPAYEFHFDNRGRIVFRERGQLLRIDSNGRRLETLAGSIPKQIDAWSVSRFDGTRFVASRQDTRTGRDVESFLSPDLSCLNVDDGSLRWRAWGWSGTLLGLDRYRLLDPSQVMSVQAASNNLVVAVCQHEGAESVFTRDVFDLDDSVGQGSDPLLPYIPWYRAAPPANWIVALDIQSKHIVKSTYFSAFYPHEYQPWGHRAGRANDLTVATAVTLSDGSLLLSGYAWTGLPATSTSWIRAPLKASYSAGYLAILDPEWSHLRFSSYLSACEDARSIVKGDRVLVYANARDDDALGLPAILEQTLQHEFGGRTDAWIMLLDLEQLTSAASAAEGNQP